MTFPKFSIKEVSAAAGFLLRWLLRRLLGSLSFVMLLQFARCIVSAILDSAAFSWRFEVQHAVIMVYTIVEHNALVQLLSIAELVRSMRHQHEHSDVEQRAEDFYALLPSPFGRFSELLQLGDGIVPDVILAIVA